MSCVDLRCGDYREVLTDVECDALITDPPYSERTHKSQDYAARASREMNTERRAIAYAAWTPADARELVELWAPRCSGWMVVATDHYLWPHFAGAMEASGRYVFSPLACVTRGGRVRLCGDGPANWAVWACVSRPRSQKFARWGALPGAYHCWPERKALPGGKELRLMDALVRDYSRPGDLVCDPCAGAGSTLRAAVRAGRRAVGAELHPETFERAQELLGLTRPVADGAQTELW